MLHLYLKDELEAKDSFLLKLGLLYEVGVDAATVQEPETLLSFQHKSLQEFAGSKHLAKRLDKIMEEGQDVKVDLDVNPFKSASFLIHPCSIGTGNKSRTMPDLCGVETILILLKRFIFSLRSFRPRSRSVVELDLHGQISNAHSSWSNFLHFPAVFIYRLATPPPPLCAGTSPLENPGAATANLFSRSMPRSRSIQWRIQDFPEGGA